ncbi:MAG: Na/Pi cotransporter family protein [Clostridiales bacterium]|nr:Na/Pi cotransporter family protein [Clostridiales bacterium]
MNYTNVLSLIGGLAIFLYGMTMMGDALERFAGNRLKSILTRLTSNPLSGFLLGLGVTAVIQSSSATTVMVVGFVNSGIMTLAQSVYIIMGANVGTSVTAWLISLAGLDGSAWYITMFKPSTFTPILALIGIILIMSAKKQRKKDLACILLGFAILMFGMDMMSDAVKPLKDMPSFTNLMTMFQNPVMGVLVGAVLTAIIQSSSASVGILQALSLTGTVSYAAAIPIIMGQNIGTCVTALLSSVGATKDARRASMVHLCFNIVGVIVWLTVFCLFRWIADPAFLNQAISPFGIAVAHSCFNILATCTLAPFGRQLAALATRLVPEGKQKQEIAMLDERLFVTPAIALERSHEVLLDMADLSIRSLKDSLQLLDKYDEKKADRIVDDESRVDMYEDKLGTYLVKLTAQPLSAQDSRELTKYLHMIGDLERISDHAVNLMESAQELHEKQLSFSADAKKELMTLCSAIDEILSNALTSLHQENLTVAGHVEPLEQVIDRLTKLIRSHHIDRLTRGDCTTEMGFILSDILTNLERVSDHCSNIAVAIIEIAAGAFDVHEYLQRVKEGPGDYRENFEMYLRKYSLQA